MSKMLEEILEQPEVLAQIEGENIPVINAIVQELNERKVSHASFAGRGTSDHACIFGQYLLGIYKGVVAALAIPSCITIYDGKPDLSNDLVIGISQSGKAVDVLSVIEQGNDCGAVTVAITNDKDSEMAKTAKYHLYCNAGQEISVAATKTFTAEMYLIALLTAYWSDNQQLLSDLRKLPEYAKLLLDTKQKDIESHLERFRYIREGFVLSRGLAYPVALEMALKIQETSYVRMKGHSISDFYHGPMAQLDMDTPVIMLAPKGKVSDDIMAIFNKVKEVGVVPLVITDDESLAEKCEKTLLVPYSGNETTQVFLFAIAAQKFAEHLAVLKGLNPDSPRLLKKVTITK